MSLLELQEVSKSYGEGPADVRAVQDIDLPVNAGALVAVMGPSGSGKSTLLTIAGSLEEPTSRGVLIDGWPLSSMSRYDKARLRRRSVGYVFQDFNLLPGLTAAENVSLPFELDGMRAKRAREVGLTILEELGPPIGRRTSPTSCQAVSASEPPSLGRSPASVISSSPTSLQAPSTLKMVRPSCG